MGGRRCCWPAQAADIISPPQFSHEAGFHPYTFKLKPGITFCSGKKLTAADVAASYARWLDPETKGLVKWRMGDVDKITAPANFDHAAIIKAGCTGGIPMLTVRTSMVTVSGAVNAASRPVSGASILLRMDAYG